MKIVLLKNYKVDLRVLPKGTEMQVSNDKGRGLIGKKVAKEIGSISYEEDLKMAIDEILEPTKGAKPKRKTKKKSNNVTQDKVK